MNKRERFPKEPQVPQRRRAPSFSSSLLDSIYDSLDESNGSYYRLDRRSRFLNPAVQVKQRLSGIDSFPFPVLSSSPSSSSGSSTGAAVSSSETESCKSKPGWTRNGVFDNGILENNQNAKHRDGGFAKAKLKAPKFSGELEKVKQPISPGRRITNFLTSVFNSGNVKKAKMCYAGAADDVSTASAPSCSRSCLKQSSSSRGKASSANRKTVKFYPVSMIIEEESKPSRLKYPAIGKKRQFLKRFLEEEEEESEDDRSSCSSSDLFEINVGIGRYDDELPVYETTSLRTNQAIANGFLL